MTVMATELQPEVLEVSGEEILAEFARVMLEWGHYKTAAGLRFPALDEARRVATGRRTDRGWNTDPISDGRPLFDARQVRQLPPADAA